MPHSKPEIETHRLAADGAFPNNPRVPLVIYRQTIEQTAADRVEQLLQSHRWGGTWQNGVFPYHHYHSNTHEVLVICDGTARLQFGGPDGPVVAVTAGDVAILPAGTAHKKVDASADFLVVGGYPAGREDYDLIRDEPSKREAAEQRIAEVPLPEQDPVFGDSGPLFQHWGS